MWQSTISTAGILVLPLLSPNCGVRRTLYIPEVLKRPRHPLTPKTMMVQRKSHISLTAYGFRDNFALEPNIVPPHHPRPTVQPSKKARFGPDY